MATNNVNDNKNIKKPTYYQCFKLNDTYYALFDIKMDMPILIESLAVVKSVKLPLNSVVFYYELNSQLFFSKLPSKYITIQGKGKHQKPPLRYAYIDPKKLTYHHFILTPVLSALFDDRFEMPLAYGGNQKIQAVLNHINKESVIFYYKEDANVPNSFKLFMRYQGKEP